MLPGNTTPNAVQKATWHPPTPSQFPTASRDHSGHRPGRAGCSLHHRGLLGLQDVVGEDPGHGHLNGELDSPAHGQLQEELSEPQLRKVTALLQCFLKESKDTRLSSAYRHRLSRERTGGAGGRAKALLPQPGAKQHGWEQGGHTQHLMRGTTMARLWLQGCPLRTLDMLSSQHVPTGRDLTKIVRPLAGLGQNVLLQRRNKNAVTG